MATQFTSPTAAQRLGAGLSLVLMMLGPRFALCLRQRNRSTLKKCTSKAKYHTTTRATAQPGKQRNHDCGGPAEANSRAADLRRHISRVFWSDSAGSFYHHCSGSAVDKTEAVRQMLLSLDDFTNPGRHSPRPLLRTPRATFRAWPLCRMEVGDIGWKREVAPGVTLLGDAAYASTPFVGEGVNCSMYDAVMLAERILQHCGSVSSLSNVPAVRLETALASFEEDMFERGRDPIRRSTESEEMLFAENAAGLLLQAISGAMVHRKSTAWRWMCIILCFTFGPFNGIIHILLLIYNPQHHGALG
ncbi:FAD-dependent oxidoreductase [Aspergillus novofumigatus IBT 16806]|uniref:FAD-binding domain-containing protein n=1 Tax=Aspergillus novofumigatus (strain IBT 16806) TaxID=1392255 RepID=A0A2I1C0X5_ASPN1|nr:uncharacterized protein P174DRAFT_286868 [Aspergillus novofumigatus IBT 16806]PKX91290.1 hypothetical protein P174DRAFT_286868 [Aspergillus novofumigatus IBT 16806]